MAIILGNDISKWQGDVNFDVYKDNTNFLIIKATEGVGFTDPKFTRNQSEARRVGIPLGYYHFARPDLGNAPEAEADYFLKIVGAPREGETFVLDYECANQVQAHVEWCRRFMDQVQSKLGLKCLIYLNQSQVQKFDWKQVVDAGYGLWIAHYTYDPNINNSIIGQWKFAAMQQWSNKQQVPGIPTVADANVFFGDIAGYKKYGYHAPQPAPQPVPEPTPPPSTPPPPVPTPPADVFDADIVLTQAGFTVAGTIGKMRVLCGVTVKKNAGIVLEKQVEAVLSSEISGLSDAQQKIADVKAILYGKGWIWQKIWRLNALLPR